MPETKGRDITEQSFEKIERRSSLHASAEHASAGIPVIVETEEGPIRGYRREELLELSEKSISRFEEAKYEEENVR